MSKVEFKLLKKDRDVAEVGLGIRTHIEYVYRQLCEEIEIVEAYMYAPEYQELDKKIQDETVDILRYLTSLRDILIRNHAEYLDVGNGD